MTSCFATNFNTGGLNPTRFLKVDKEGIPLQKQVALSFQVYSGTGNETIDFDGSNCLVIDSTLSAGDLTIDFSPLNNNYGRECAIVSKRTLANDLILSFTGGEIIEPGVPGPLTSVTLPSGTGPSTASLIFFERLKAAFIKGFTVQPPSLTTNFLSFEWEVDALNEFNEPAPGLPMLWSDKGLNQTDLVLSGLGGDPVDTARLFEVATEADYDISYDAFMTGPLTSCIATWIDVDGDIYGYKECAFGLTGQSSSGNIRLHLMPNQVISIYAQNAAGPNAAANPFTPAQDFHGHVNITQFI